MPTMRNRIRDRRNPVRGGVLGCASGISVTFQNNARGITGLAQVAATQVSDGRVAHSIAHSAIEWGHDAADASQNKSRSPEQDLRTREAHSRRHCSPSHCSVTQVLYGPRWIRYM